MKLHPIALKTWQWFALAMLVLLGFAIAYMPSQQFITRVMPTNAPQQISGLSGTVWQGKAQRLLVKGIAINNISWQLSPWALLRLQLGVDVQAGNIRNADEVYAKGNIGISLLDPSNIKMRDTQVFVPANAVMAQVKLPVPVSAKGRFRVDVDTLEIDQQCIALKGAGAWLNGQVSGLQGPIDFGSFNAQLSCNKGDFVVQVAPQNKLSLDAKLQISLQGKYSVKGQFKADPSLPNEVHQAASFFGQVDSEGFRRIDL